MSQESPIQHLIDKFIVSYSRWPLDPQKDYLWIPVEKTYKTGTDLVLQPQDITVNGGNTPIRPLFLKVLDNVEKILKIFVDLNPTIHISAWGYSISKLQLSFQIPENQDPADFGYEIRKRTGNILGQLEPDIINNQDNTYTMVFQI